MKKILLIIVLLISILFTGCIKKVEKSDLKNNLINIGLIPNDISMLKLDKSSLSLPQNLFGTLVSINDFGDVVPYLAKEYEVSEDGLTYTFIIDENAYWSNGDKITSKDFYDCFQEIFSPKLDSNIDTLLGAVSNLSSYKRNRSIYSRVGIKLNGLDKIQFILNEQFPDLPKVLSMPQFSLRRDVELLTSWKETYKDIVYSGAYKIDDIKYEKGIVLKANDYYVFRKDVIEDEIIIVDSDSEEETIANFSVRNLQLATDLPINQVSEYMNSSNLVISNSKDIKAVVFNQNTNSIVSDIICRENILSYISPTDICNNAFPKMMLKGNNIFDREVNVFSQSTIPITKNIEKTIYEGSGSRNLTLITKKNYTNKQVANEIVKSLKEGNYNVKIKLLNDAEYEFAIEENEYDMILMDFNYRYDTDLTLVEKFYSEDIENYIGYKNNSYDELFKEAIKEPNIDDRYLKISECRRIVEDEVIVIPLVENIDFLLKTNKVLDVASNNNGVIKLSKIKFNN